MSFNRRYCIGAGQKNFAASTSGWRRKKTPLKLGLKKSSGPIFYHLIFKIEIKRYLPQNFCPNVVFTPKFKKRLKIEKKSIFKSSMELPKAAPQHM